MSGVRIAIVIPVRNGADFLGDALAGVLGQSRAPDEVVVVDDGSTDATAATAGRFAPRVRVLASPRRGPAAARNAGIAATTSELIGFLDHDDLMEPGALAVQEALALSDPTPDAVVGRTLRLRRAAPGLAFVAEGAPYRAISFGASLVRRSAFAAAGPIDDSRLHGADVAWFGRAAAVGLRIVVHDAVVQRYRLHEKNLTNDAERNRAGFFGALREVARGRAAGTAP